MHGDARDWGMLRHSTFHPIILKGRMTPSLNVDRNSLTCGDPLLRWTWPVMTLWQNGMFRILVHLSVGASLCECILVTSGQICFCSLWSYAHQCIAAWLLSYGGPEVTWELFGHFGKLDPSAPHSITKDNRLCRCSFIVGYITLLFLSHLMWG